MVFVQGETYLVYGVKAGLDIYKTSKCTRTAHINDVIGDVGVLDKLPCELEEDARSTNQATFAKENDPVCGCDGVTYTSAYEASKAKIRSWTTGSCDIQDAINNRGN